MGIVAVHVDCTPRRLQLKRPSPPVYLGPFSHSVVGEPGNKHVGSPTCQEEDNKEGVSLSSSRLSGWSRPTLPIVYKDQTPLLAAPPPPPEEDHDKREPPPPAPAPVQCAAVHEPDSRTVAIPPLAASTSELPSAHSASVSAQYAAVRKRSSRTATIPPLAAPTSELPAAPPPELPSAWPVCVFWLSRCVSRWSMRRRPFSCTRVWDL